MLFSPLFLVELVPFLELLAVEKLSLVKHFQRYAFPLLALSNKYILTSYLVSMRFIKIPNVACSTLTLMLWFMLDVEREEMRWLRYAFKVIVFAKVLHYFCCRCVFKFFISGPHGFPSTYDDIAWWTWGIRDEKNYTCCEYIQHACGCTWSIHLHRYSLKCFLWLLYFVSFDTTVPKVLCSVSVILVSLMIIVAWLCWEIV